MKHTRRFKSEIFYAEPVDRVWKALVDPAQVREWLTRGDFKPVRGHRFKWKEPKNQTSPLEDAICEIEDVQAPQRLSYRLEHGDGISVVTWMLEPIGDGTRLIVEQELCVTAELKLHPGVISLAQYRRQRTMLRMPSELEAQLRSLEGFIARTYGEVAA